MSVRRPLLAAATALALAAGTAATLGAPAQADDAARTTLAAPTKAATTGRFLTATKKGVVLVDEDGGDRTVIVRARGEEPAVVDAHPETGTYLWSSTQRKKTTYHITNLYGADLGDFRTPKGVSLPATDNGGYEVYWVRPGTGSTPAALMAWEINDPNASPQVLRELVPGTGGRVTVSPDFQWIAVTLTDATSTKVHLVSADGSVLRTVPATAPGATVRPARVAFSPDSGQVAFTSGAPGAVGTPYRAPVAGDYAPVPVGTTPSVVLDWAPDASSLLVQTASGSLAGTNALTGAQSATYPVSYAARSDIFWSGLGAGDDARDKARPRLKVDQSGAPTVKNWRLVTGTATDKGGSQLRYVIFRAFQKRGNAWWGLVGNGKRPTWKKFPNRIEAKLYAKERRAKITGDEWQLGIPGLTAGRLVLRVKAVDGAGNTRTKEVAVTVR